MFGLSGAEIFIILVFAFIVFGPDKLPELGKKLGNFLGQLRDFQANAAQNLKNGEILAQEKPKVSSKISSSSHTKGEEHRDTQKKNEKKVTQEIKDDEEESFLDKKRRLERERKESNNLEGASLSDNREHSDNNDDAPSTNDSFEKHDDDDREERASKDTSEKPLAVAEADKDEKYSDNVVSENKKKSIKQDKEGEK